jgi:ABC-type uncharacterized transport system ATPase subunit
VDTNPRSPAIQKALKARKLSYTYPGGEKAALEDFSADFLPGEIHALIGDNGAGKTTLVKLIAGALPLQAGQLIWGEEELKKSRADRLNLGISWIPQAPELALDFKVWEHIILGQEEGHPLSLDSRASIRRIKGIQDRYEIPLPLGCQVRMLNAGQLQLMSLISALLSEPEILLLDEPTASLNQGETGHLHKILQNLKGQGKIILLISHKLPEVQLLADKVSLLQGGRLLASFSSGEKGMAELRQLYSETRMRENQGFRDPNKSTVFAVEGLGYETDGRRYLSGLDFLVKEGEIVAILGMKEDGLEILEDLLFGIKNPTSGKLTLFGEASPSFSPEDLRKKSLGYVPTDRMGRGSSQEASLQENLIPHRVPDLQIMGFLLPEAVRSFFQRIQRAFRIQGKGEDAMGSLSGGNVQKFILTREIEKNPRFLLIAEPTWGLDQNNRRQILETIRQKAQDGMSILLLSSDPEECLAVAQRIKTLYKGQLSRSMDARDWTLDSLRQELLGISDSEPKSPTISLESGAPKSSRGRNE